MFKLKFHKKIDKDLSKLSIELRSQIVKKHFPKIAENPYSFPILQGKLKNFRKYSFKYKNSEYRIAYSIENKEVIVYIIMIAPRENFYKRLKLRTT